MRPLILVLCALALAAGPAATVALLTRPDRTPPVRAIELGDDTAPAPTPTTGFAPPVDDDD